MTFRNLPLGALLLLTPATALAEAPPPPEEYARPPEPPVSPVALPALDPGIRRMIEIALAGDDEAAAKQVLAIAAKGRARQQDGDRRDGSRLAGETRRHRGSRESPAHRQAAPCGAAGELERRGGVRRVPLHRRQRQSRCPRLARRRARGSTVDAQAQRPRRTAEHQRDDDHRADIRRLSALTKHGQTGLQLRPCPIRARSFAGYDSRYTLGGGFGYRLATESRFKMEVEGGPALRWTDDVVTGMHSHLVGRGSVNLEWKITPTLSLTHKTAVYLESGDGNAQSDTALDTKLIGALKARFSYNIQYEGNPPVGTARSEHPKPGDVCLQFLTGLRSGGLRPPARHPNRASRATFRADSWAETRGRVPGAASSSDGSA